MRRRKFLSLMLICFSMMALVACSNKTDNSGLFKKEGLAPYGLTESEKYILQSFGMEDTSQIISFNGPKEAMTLKVNVYRLDGNENWVKLDSGAISTGSEREPIEQLSGNLTMQLQENHAIDFNINTKGKASFKTEEIQLDKETVASAKVFLKKFQKIELNKEIPVALMVYNSGTSIRSYSLQDYFDPSKFQGMDLVQVVTLTFSDKEF